MQFYLDIDSYQLSQGSAKTQEFPLHTITASVCEAPLAKHKLQFYNFYSRTS